MRPTRLKIDNGAETVPRLINGYGKLPERRGEWGLVLLPAAGKGMLIVSWKDTEKPPGVWHIGSTGNAGDGPRAPSPGTVGNLQSQLNAMQALRERGAAGELGDIVLRGEWRAWMHCTPDGPVVELHRKLGGYVEARVESCPAHGDWAWTLSRKPRWHGEAEERTGKAATLRAAIEEVVQESVALAGSSCGVRDTRRRGALDADYTGKAGAVRPSRSRAGRSVEQWTPGLGRTRARKRKSTAPPPRQSPPQLLTVVHHGLKASNLVDWTHIWATTPPERQRRLSVAIDETRRLTAKEWDAFAIELMEDRDWLRGKGGTRTLWDGAGDRDFLQLSEAEQERWRAGAYNVVIAVVAPGRPPLYVDPQGYPYARYVYVAEADLPELARLAHLEGVGPEGYYRRALAAWNEWAVKVGLVGRGLTVEEWAHELADEAEPRAEVARMLDELGVEAERLGVAEGWAEGQRGQLRRALLGILAALEAGWAPAGSPAGSGKVLSFPGAAPSGAPQIDPPPDSVMVRAEALAGEVEAFFREVEQTFRAAPIHSSLAKVHIEKAQRRVMAPELLRKRAAVLTRGDLEVVERDLKVARFRFEHEADRVLGRLPERADVLERPAFLAIAHWLEGMSDQKWVAKPIRDLFLSFVLEGTVGGRPGSTEQLRGAVQSILNASTRRGALDRDHAARWPALWKAFEHLVDHRMPPLPVEPPTPAKPAPTPADVSTDARAILAELDEAQVVAAPAESRIVRQAIEWLEARAGEDDNVGDALVILRGHFDDAVNPERLADETVAAPDEIVEQVVTHVLNAEEDRRWNPEKSKLSEGWADAFVGPDTPGAWATGPAGSTVLNIGPREYLLAHPGSIAGRLLDYLQRTPPQLWGVAGLLAKARKLLDSPLCRGQERQEAARKLRRAVLAWTQRRPMLPEEQRAHLRALAEGAEELAARCSAGQRDLFAVAPPARPPAAEPPTAAEGVVGTVRRALDAFLQATGYPDQSGLLRGRLDKWLDTGVGWDFTRKLMATIRREALEQMPSARSEIHAAYEGLVDAVQAARSRRAAPAPAASAQDSDSGALEEARQFFRYHLHNRALVHLPETRDMMEEYLRQGTVEGWDGPVRSPRDLVHALVEGILKEEAARRHDLSQGEVPLLAAGWADAFVGADPDARRRAGQPAAWQDDWPTEDAVGRYLEANPGSLANRLLTALEGGPAREPAVSDDGDPWAGGQTLQIRALRRQGTTADGFVGSVPVRVGVHSPTDLRVETRLGIEQNSPALIDTLTMVEDAWVARNVRPVALERMAVPLLPEGRKTQKRMVAWARSVLAGRGVARASVSWAAREKRIDVELDRTDLPAGWTGEALAYELETFGPRGIKLNIEAFDGADMGESWLATLEPTTAPPKRRRRKRSATKPPQNSPKTSAPQLTEAEKEARLEAKLHDALASSLQSILGATP